MDNTIAQGAQADNGLTEVISLLLNNAVIMKK